MFSLAKRSAVCFIIWFPKKLEKLSTPFPHHQDSRMPSVLAMALALQDREAEEMLRAAGGWCPLNPLFSTALEIEPTKHHFSRILEDNI